MVCDGRICSAKQAIGDRDIWEYPLFESTNEEKRVAIWQPKDRVYDLYEHPQPDSRLQDKATAFVERAVDRDAHLALAPEWAYDTSWIPDHEQYLFSSSSPLFVLGCAQKEKEVMQAEIDELEDDGFTCIPSDVPTDDSNDLLTPTVIPIRGVTDDDEIEKILLIQFKNDPLGDSHNPREELDLIEGDFVWKIDPEDPQLEVLALTCSDLLDRDLRSAAIEFAGSTNSIVAHVQCNPKPFYDIWRRFRRGLFEAKNGSVTYVTANWHSFQSRAGTTDCGYSGVYTKAPSRTPLSNYDDIYLNGGLPATHPHDNCEMTWLVTDEDAISVFQFNRADPASPGAAGPSFADIHIPETLVWDGNTYSPDRPGVPECTHRACRDWASLLPDGPLDIELISSVALGKLSTAELDDLDTLIPTRDLDWSTIDNLTVGPLERPGHILADHENRGGPDPSDVSATLWTAFNLAEREADVVPTDNFALKDLPVNAEYSSIDNSISISLTVVDNPSEKAKLERLNWMNEWFQIQMDDDDDDDDDGTNIPFKPVLVRLHDDGQYRYSELPEYERVDSGIPEPEHVDVTRGIGGGD